ncbi:MAG: hypothetical protein WCK89_15980 [bacterium]
MTPEDKLTRKWKDAPVWLRAVWLVAIINFVACFVVAAKNGGDAVNGKEEGGRFFVASHGHYTEVTRSFFEYSRIHTYSIWVTHPLAIIGAFWFWGCRRERPE